MCPDRELLSAWIDGEVPSPWRETIERHIGSCDSCSEAAASVRRVRALFSSDVGAMAASEAASKARVEDRLSFAALRATSRPSSFWSGRFAVPFPAAAAAALVLALLGVALVGTGRRNAELRMAVQRAYDATPVAASGMGIEAVIDFISKQNSAVNINITLPANAYGGSAGEPFIVREADYQAGIRQ
jgi:anti-sigma factor RsiW